MNKTRKAWVVFGLWTLSVLSLLLLLLTQYPTPSALAAAGTLDARGRWKVVHVLAAGAPCSERISHVLVRRGMAGAGDADEALVLLGQDLTIAARMKAAGWPVAVADPEESRSDYGIGGAPWLLIYDPAGSLRYSGSYLGVSLLSSNAPLEDIAILRRLRAGDQSQGRVGADPLRVEYASAPDYTPPPLPVP